MVSPHLSPGPPKAVNASMGLALVAGDTRALVSMGSWVRVWGGWGVMGFTPKLCRPGQWGGGRVLCPEINRSGVKSWRLHPSLAVPGWHQAGCTPKFGLSGVTSRMLHPKM